MTYEPSLPMAYALDPLGDRSMPGFGGCCELVRLRDAWLNPPNASDDDLKTRTLTKLYDTAFGVAIISDRNLQAFHYNVVAFGKQGHFAKPLQTGTRIKLVVQAQSQPDNIATLPLLTATFVQQVRPVAIAPQ
jgi:hypothetical protein